MAAVSGALVWVIATHAGGFQWLDSLAGGWRGRRVSSLIILNVRRQYQLQTPSLVYDTLPLEEGAGKRCLERVPTTDFAWTLKASEESTHASPHNPPSPPPTKTNQQNYHHHNNNNIPRQNIRLLPKAVAKWNNIFLGGYLLKFKDFNFQD